MVVRTVISNCVLRSETIPADINFSTSEHVLTQTPSNTKRLKKMTVAQLIRKNPASYRIRSFITMVQEPAIVSDPEPLDFSPSSQNLFL
jgi:hypothetical protein